MAFAIAGQVFGQVAAGIVGTEFFNRLTLTSNAKSPAQTLDIIASVGSLALVGAMRENNIKFGIHNNFIVPMRPQECTENKKIPGLTNKPRPGLDGLFLAWDRSRQGQKRNVVKRFEEVLPIFHDMYPPKEHLKDRQTFRSLLNFTLEGVKYAKIPYSNPQEDNENTLASLNRSESLIKKYLEEYKIEEPNTASSSSATAADTSEDDSSSVLDCSRDLECPSAAAASSSLPADVKSSEDSEDEFETPDTSLTQSLDTKNDDLNPEIVTRPSLNEEPVKAALMSIMKEEAWPVSEIKDLVRDLKEVRNPKPRASEETKNIFIRLVQSRLADNARVYTAVAERQEVQLFTFQKE